MRRALVNESGAASAGSLRAAESDRGDEQTHAGNDEEGREGSQETWD
jgi:hypothetical protein